MKTLNVAILGLLTILTFCANSQNLIPNPGFELHVKCPMQMGQLSRANFWSSPTEADPDYFNGCADNSFDLTGVPYNKMGVQKASSGNGYCGFYAISNRAKSKFNSNRSDTYREYLQVGLKNPLLSDEQYCFSMKVSLSTSSNVAISQLGVALSHDLLDESGIELLEIEYVKVGNEDRAFLDATEWIEVRGSLTASGRENYLVVGNFQDNTTIDTISVIGPDFEGNKLERMAYYFIDDVCLVPVSENWTCNCGSFSRGGAKPKVKRIIKNVSLNPLEREFEVGEEVILENVLFETDKSNLKDTVQIQLDYLVELLEKRQILEIEIVGHTDNVGSPVYNFELSVKRAKAVFDYLTDAGIDSRRVTWKGYGENKPIASNETIKGRTLNRRVAFRVLTR